MTVQEEKNLINKVIGGDKDAFEDLVLANQKNVYNLALKMTRNTEDALDISQEAFIKAYKNLSVFRSDSRFSVWLYKITYNLCIDKIRKDENEKTLPLDYETDDDTIKPIEIPDARNLPEDIAARRETRTAIAECINKLPQLHREVIILREVTGMSYEDISDTLKISMGTVQSRLSRARLKLMQLLTQRGTYPDNFRHNKQEGGAS